jgi:hypothetical protein
MATGCHGDSYFQDLFGRAQKTTDYTGLQRRAAMSMHICLVITQASMLNLSYTRRIFYNIKRFAI